MSYSQDYSPCFAVGISRPFCLPNLPSLRVSCHRSRQRPWISTKTFVRACTHPRPDLSNQDTNDPIHPNHTAACETNVPQRGVLDDGLCEEGDEELDLTIEMAEGLAEGSRARPMLDLDSDDRLILQKLRAMMHKDDFERIFNPKDRRIGEYL